MKFNRNNLPFLIIIVILFNLISCENEEDKKEILYKVYIDNPTQNKYTIFINGQKNKIKPKTNEIFELEEGEYHFKGLNDKQQDIFEENVKVDTTILINIAQQNYYLVSEIYSDDKSIYKRIKLDTIEINGQTLIGLFKKLPANKFFYKREWQYEMNDSMPQNLPFSKDYRAYSKLVREKDLISYYLRQ